MKRIFLLVAVAAGVLFPAGAQAVNPRIPWFHLGNRAVYCHVDLASNPPILGCWRPASGYVVSMATGSVVHKVTTRKYRHTYEDSSPVLRKGQLFRYKGFRCVSSGRAVTCSNLRHHGWRLGAGSLRRVF